MSVLLQDIRYAFRQLRKSPAFAVVAMVTLALAIGVATSVFSVLDAAIVRPLPYHEPASIVMLQPYSPQGYTQPASYPQYVDWRRENSTLEELAGFQRSTANMQGPGGAVPVRSVSGTDNLFRVLGVAPLFGRTFAAGEDRQGRGSVVVLSYELWQQTFGGRRDVLGQTVSLDGAVCTVIGVMPAGFRFPLSQNNVLYRPLVVSTIQEHARGNHFLPTIARLKRGVTVAQAQADLAHVLTNVARSHPDEANKRIEVIPFAQYALGKTAGPLRVLTLAVFGILAIGCVNIAGLLLARGVRRQRELSLRSAVGAARTRIIRQLLTEAAVLSLAGAGCGVIVAAGLLQILRQMLVRALSRGADVHLNFAVLAAALAVAVISGLAAGAFPAIHFSRVSPSEVLRSGGAAGTSRGQNHLRSALILLQVAIALSLLVCSGVLLRNLNALRSTDLGFSPDNLLTEEIDLTRENYAHRDILTSFYQPLIGRVRAIPGVQEAGVINYMPVDSYGMNSDVQIAGHPPAPPNQEQLAEVRIVTPGVVGAIGASLVRGRLLSDSLDTPTSALVATVNQAFVDKFFSPGEDPIGKQIVRDDKITIVGVTSNVRQNLTSAPMAEVDFPAAHSTGGLDSALPNMILVIRTKVPPQSITGAVKEAIKQVDPSVPFRPALTMQDIIADTLTFQRLESWLFSIFAGLALLLSMVGIYGVIHHEVELSTRDIGIRMALGSSRVKVLSQILGRVSFLMIGGISIGWVVTLLLQKVLASVVELHASQNFLLLAAITAALVIIGIAASLMPARRATTVDPMQALRNQ